MQDFIKIISVIGIIILVSAIGFDITSALVYGFCKIFGFAFSWKTAFGIWLLKH